jgi:uncharacterized protein YkwD
MLSPRVLARTVVAVLVGFAAVSQPAAPAAASEARGESLLASATLPALEAALLDRVNVDRAAQGLTMLAWDPELAAIARIRAMDQLPLERLSHLDGNGEIAAWKLFLAAGVSYRVAGENLARLPGADASAAARAEEALMRSATHRSHILHPDYDRMGVGAATDATGRIIFVQLFRGV